MSTRDSTPAWFLDAIEHATLAGIASVTPEGIQNYVNPAFCRMVGWSEGELVGAHPPFLYWPAEEIDAIAGALRQTLAGEAPPDGFELRFCRRDGTRFDVQVLLAPLRDDDGNSCGYLASVYDLTEHKRLEQVRFEETIHRLGVSLVQELDEQRLLQRIVDEATRLAEAEFGAFAPTFEGTENVRCADIRADPRPRPPGMDRTAVSYLAVPVRNRAGEVLGGLYFGRRDPGRFTERHERLVTSLAAHAAVALDNARLYAALRRSRAIAEGQRNVLELIARGAPLSETLEAIVTIVEQHAPPGLRASILLLDGERKHLRHGAAPSLPEAYNRAIDGVEVGPDVGSCGTAAFLGEEVLVTDIDEDPLWRDFKDIAAAHDLRACWSTPIRSSDGEVLGTIAIYYDKPRPPTDEERQLVTTLNRTAAIAVERRRNEEALDEANRRKDEFLALLGHELRNPLAPILTALQLMELRGGPGDRERQVIERQVRHMVQLVDDLLDISRITRGKVDLKRQRVDLAQVIAKAVEMASPLLEHRAHNLKLDVPRAKLNIEGDPVRLAQVFANLLTNAAKYTSPGGHIEVSAADNGDEAELCVRDDGIGIAPELLPRIFEPFVQGERILEGAQGGLGLGLPLVNSLVKLHGGAVSVYSDGPGHGSEFRVTLPLLRGARITAPMQAIPVEPAQTADRKRVLVVDDNEDAADLLADVLRAHGHEVLVAHDGPEALAIAERAILDAAIVDIGLPVMDGYEVGRRLASQSTILLVALTGYGQDTDRQRSAESGFALHLVKPVDTRTVLAALAHGSDA